MAVDIRRSRSRSAQRWLEKTLLSLEDAGVIEATKERRPPHYHVAIFPSQYMAYLNRKDVDVQLVAAAETTVRVGSGDSLWGIATRHGTTVDAIVRVNGLRSKTIFPGQTLRIPAR
jgi:nucleoid-associated protein YgaU